MVNPPLAVSEVAKRPNINDNGREAAFVSEFLRKTSKPIGLE